MSCTFWNFIVGGSADFRLLAQIKRSITAPTRCAGVATKQRTPSGRFVGKWLWGNEFLAHANVTDSYAEIDRQQEDLGGRDWAVDVGHTSCKANRSGIFDAGDFFI